MLPAATHCLVSGNAWGTATGLAGLQGLFLIGMLVCARLATMLGHWGGSSSSSSSRGGGAISADAAARLARVESVADTAAADIARCQRTLIKDALHTRVVSGEMQKPLADAQLALQRHAEALGKLATAQQALRSHLDSHEQVLAAMQGLSEKQFGVSPSCAGGRLAG